MFMRILIINLHNPYDIHLVKSSQPCIVIIIRHQVDNAGGGI